MVNSISTCTIGTIFILLLSFQVRATIFEIGTGKEYENPNELFLANVLNDNDTIHIEAETYAGNGALAVWQNNNLFIRGVNGRPHMKAAGAYIWGKGIWVLAGNNITVDNVEFSEASVPDKNGAGIRLDGIGLTVNRCYFHNNENGILTSNPGSGHIAIRHSEFGYNGFGDGFSHNIYVGRVAAFTFEFNYSHHAKVGHCVKSRAMINTIRYNRIMDEETGNSSRLIDISNGGYTVIMGNILMQGPMAENRNMIGYGLEGFEAFDIHYLRIVNNTFVNRRLNSCLFLDITQGTIEAFVVNNIFAGVGEFAQGPFIQRSNIFEENITEMNFVDEQNFQYQLLPQSPAINTGIIVDDDDGIVLTPSWVYQHVAEAEPRTVVGDIDIGAYEFEEAVSIDAEGPKTLFIYPNPTLGKLFFSDDMNGTSWVLYDLNGQLKSNGLVRANSIDISNMSGGIYFLNIRSHEKLHFSKIVKLSGAN